ncbi:MAG: CRISPR system precrRNA processing endoribonuclease RAMP protein Cas6 [bacterium]|nr:CRISPR system precrRNA processing endoribonuclease RAMP protein Cas6 [bacterium]
METPSSFHQFYLHQYIIRFKVIGVFEMPNFETDYIKSILGLAIQQKFGANSKIGEAMFDARNENKSVRPPYIIRNVLPAKPFILTGDFLSFELILFGNFNTELHALLPAIELMAENMRDENCTITFFSIHELGIPDVSDEVKFSPKKIIKLQNPITYGLFKDISFKEEEITFRFESPVCNTNFKDDLQGFNFYKIVFDLASTLNLLASTYGVGEKVDIDLWCEDAKHIKPESISLKRWEQERSKGHVLHGHTGIINYSGRFNRYLPLLYFGQWIHIGKNTSLGCGKYSIE